MYQIDLGNIPLPSFLAVCTYALCSCIRFAPETETSRHKLSDMKMCACDFSNIRIGKHRISPIRFGTQHGTYLINKDSCEWVNEDICEWVTEQGWAWFWRNNVLYYRLNLLEQSIPSKKFIRIYRGEKLRCRFEETQILFPKKNKRQYAWKGQC